jgi:hypothetical protein
LGDCADFVAVRLTSCRFLNGPCKIALHKNTVLNHGGHGGHGEIAPR